MKYLNAIAQSRWLPAAAVLVGLATLPGCSTPKPALDLAAEGALSVEIAQQELERFVRQSERVYAAREAMVRAQAAGDIRDVSSGAFDTWLSGKAGQPAFDTNVKLLKELADEKKALREKIEAQSAAKTAEISKLGGEPIQVPVEKLAVSKKAFLVLAQELSTQEWLELSWKYGKQLQEDLKKVQKELDDAKKKASDKSP